MAKNLDNYDAKSIVVLAGLAPVRKRPAMYVGSTGKSGLHHLIWEVIDNSIDEAIAGFANKIEIILHPKNKVEVLDNGRGIPIDIHPQTKKPALQTVMTTLHAGGKFDHGVYKVSGGLHGVGVSVVNALSAKMEVEVYRDGKIYCQEYKKGKAVTKVKICGKSKKTGTKVIFEPDPEIFKTLEFSWNKILEHLRQQAYLTKKTEIIIEDKRKKPSRIYSFYFEGGIKSYLDFLNQNKTKISPIIYFEKTKDNVVCEVAFQYTDDFSEHSISFANNIYNQEGGTHLTGFRAALTRVINDYAKKSGFVKDEKESLSGEDVREGLSALISIKLPEPQFEGQTKTKLGNTEIRPIVEGIVAENFLNYLEEHPQEAKAIAERCFLAAQARKAAKAARETVIRKGALEGMTLPGKLADCSSKDPEKSELYIVEGNSAGGSAKQARNRKFQAILPLKGKILNVERARLDKMLQNAEIKSLIVALGAGISEELNLKRLRYKRIIIMTDADVDGAHIRTLLLTLFYRHFQDLIVQGNLYIAQPPLYQIQVKGKGEYAYTEKEKEEILAKLEKKAKKPNIQRYKGLGEMNPGQLWKTTMNPENRILYRVAIEDAEKADRIFSKLMGAEVEPRKRFIQLRAKKVKNLDI